MLVMYKSLDGKIFYDADKCLDHENEILSKVVFYDEQGCEMKIEEIDYSFDYIMKIHVKESAKCVKDFFDYINEETDFVAPVFKGDGVYIYEFREDDEGWFYYMGEE